MLYKVYLRKIRDVEDLWRSPRMLFSRAVLWHLRVKPEEPILSMQYDQGFITREET